uniref:Uncharacterized protein n=2 Tax=Acrobeloides nanus TaxID=290746 RepID=A0A914EJD3_9BILA
MYRRNSHDMGLIDEPLPTFPTKDGCIARVPYASVMAFVMCVIGVILFAITMVWSFNASIEQAKRALEIENIPWLDKVYLSFIIVAVLMIIMALFLLCIAVLSTGSTREEVYGHSNARRGGRASCVMGLIVAYVLNILWMLVLSVTAILSFIYYIFSGLCASLTVYNETNCLDFSLFKPFVKDFSVASLVLCGGKVQQFCASTNTVITWYVVGFVGSMIICLGLTQFLATNAANYAHLNNENRYIELKEVMYNEGMSADRELSMRTTVSRVTEMKRPPQVPSRGYETSVNRSRTTTHETPNGHNVRRNSYQRSLHELNGWADTQY